MTKVVYQAATPAGATVIAAPGAGKRLVLRSVHISGHIKLHTTTDGDLFATSGSYDEHGYTKELTENEALLATGTGNVSAMVVYRVDDV